MSKTCKGCSAQLTAGDPDLCERCDLHKPDPARPAETCGHGTWLATCKQPHGVIRGSRTS